MSHPPYKVTIPYGYDALPPVGNLGTIWSNHEASEALRDRATIWLQEAGRLADLLAVYDNQQLGMTFVLSDRHTAIMLRLAVC